MMLGNDLLLRRLICPRFLDLLDLAGTADDFFDFAGAEATLRDPVSVAHLVADDRVDEANLDSLRIAIEDGRVAVAGSMSLAGTGWTATVPMEGSVAVGINDAGEVGVSTEVAAGTPDVEFEWWVWLLGILGGTIILPVIGTVVVAVTLALLDDVVEESFAGALEGLFPAPEIPAPDPPGEMEIDEVFLDDLAVYGRPRFSEEPPETTVPEVWIDGELEVTDVQGTGTTFTTVAGAVEILRTTFERAHHGSFRARRRLLMAPMTFRWYLDDHRLSGDGTREVDGAEVRYSADGDTCEIWTELGDDLDTELEVRVEDARGVAVEAWLRLTAEGGTESMGVTGEEALMGPLAELFLTEPHRAIDELTALGTFLEWGTRPDELEEEETWNRSGHLTAMRAALGRGMDMDLTDLPFHG